MKLKISVIIAISIIIAIVKADILPNRTATVNAIATGTASCGNSAEAQVKGNHTNQGLIAIGISAINFNGPKVYNNDLAAKPPHYGHGSGSASVTQTGTCKVTTDAHATPSYEFSFKTSRSTNSCENGE